MGELNSVCINNSQTAILCAGDEFCISFRADAISKINSPIFALRVRDSKGQEIYGTNTKILNDLKQGYISVEYAKKHYPQLKLKNNGL